MAEGLTNVVRTPDATQRPRERPAPRASSSRSRSPTTASAARPIDGGTGLRGLSDRLAALEGELMVDSPLGEGTRLGRGSRARVAGGGRCACALLLLIALAIAGGLRQHDQRLASPTSWSAATRRPRGAAGRRARARRGLRIATARIAFVTHGQASDPFWAIVKKGVDDAARQTGVAVSYRAPDSYSIQRMSGMIDEAIGDRPDGLVVSLPDVKALAPAIRRAGRAGIPVVTINSGSDQFRKLGVLAHVGQPEFKAGVGAGERLGARGRAARAVRQPGARQRRAGRALSRHRDGDAAGRRHAARAAASTSRTRPTRGARSPPRSAAAASTA